VVGQWQGRNVIPSKTVAALGLSSMTNSLAMGCPVDDTDPRPPRKCFELRHCLGEQFTPRLSDHHLRVAATFLSGDVFRLDVE
jgi:hypothetical protein